MHARSIRPVAVAASVLLLVSACSSAGLNGPVAAPATAPGGAASSGEVSVPATGGSASSGTASKMSMRVANLFDPKGAAGPALDVYDVRPTGQKVTPIVSNVAYGSVSSYFTPHAENGFGQPIVQLWVMPAGDDPVTKQAEASTIGGAQDDGSHPQITFVLSADTGSVMDDGQLTGLSFSTRVEKGTDQGSKGPVAPAPPSGSGEILVEQSAVGSLNHGALSLYLLVDDSCTPPINGDPNSPGVPYIFNGDAAGISSAFAIFPTTPGSHSVSLVSWSGDDEPTCAQLTAKQGTTSIDVTAGQQVEAYVYGTSVTDLHLAVAPLKQ